MPENPGNYRAIPPVTVVTTTPQGVRTPSTNVGTMPQIHASPEAMADPVQAARMFATLQKQTATLAAQQTSDPHSGRVIIKDQTFPIATNPGTSPGPFQLILHGLGRAYVGWMPVRPRSPTVATIPGIIEVTDANIALLRIAFPAVTILTPDRTKFIAIAAPTNISIFDIEVW